MQQHFRYNSQRTHPAAYPSSAVLSYRLTRDFLSASSLVIYHVSLRREKHGSLREVQIRLALTLKHVRSTLGNPYDRASRCGNLSPLSSRKREHRISPGRPDPSRYDFSFRGCFYAAVPVWLPGVDLTTETWGALRPNLHISLDLARSLSASFFSASFFPSLRPTPLHASPITSCSLHRTRF